MQIRGIKRGQTIELTENIAVPDGSEIILEISPPSPGHQKNIGSNSVNYLVLGQTNPI